jgi:hypothetical protein
VQAVIRTRRAFAGGLALRSGLATLVSATSFAIPDDAFAASGKLRREAESMKSARVKNACKIARMACVAALISFSMTAPHAHPASSQGDGIFAPVISPVASIDRTGRPITAEATQPEPSFAAQMAAGKATGDSYILNFPSGSAGGPCVYNGKGRYLIESTGNLTFQILADCGNLRRAYSFIVCRLNESLRCSEAPWWYFKDRTYAATEQGVVINGSTTILWSDPAAAPGELQTMAAKIKAMNDRFRSDPHAAHTRLISCRNFHPETRSYDIHELPASCLIESLCNGIPNASSLQDGDVIDWNSPLGNYVKQQNKIADVSTWTCWIRTQ